MLRVRRSAKEYDPCMTSEQTTTARWTKQGVDFAEREKSEYPEKNPRSQITCGAQESNLGRRGGRREWWPLHQPDSPRVPSRVQSTRDNREPVLRLVTLQSKQKSFPISAIKMAAWRLSCTLKSISHSEIFLLTFFIQCFQFYFSVACQWKPTIIVDRKMRLIKVYLLNKLWT